MEGQQGLRCGEANPNQGLGGHQVGNPIERPREKDAAQTRGTTTPGLMMFITIYTKSEVAYPCGNRCEHRTLLPVTCVSLWKPVRTPDVAARRITHVRIFHHI